MKFFNEIFSKILQVAILPLRESSTWAEWTATFTSRSAASSASKASRPSKSSEQTRETQKTIRATGRRPASSRLRRKLPRRLFRTVWEESHQVSGQYLKLETRGTFCEHLFLKIKIKNIFFYPNDPVITFSTITLGFT